MRAIPTVPAAACAALAVTAAPAAPRAAPPRPEDCEAAIFAGGDGRRLGGGKALRQLAGRPLLAHVVEALTPQVARVRVVARSANHAEALVAAVAAYLPAGTAARLDAGTDRSGLTGPVAALFGAVDAAQRPFLLTSAVDTPFLPSDVVTRLGAVLDGAAAVAADDRLHPTQALYRVLALRTLRPRASLHETLAPLRPRIVRFAPGTFLNVNTAQDLAAAETLAARAPRR